MTVVEKSEISPHLKCVMWIMSQHMYKMLFCWLIGFVAIYAVLRAIGLVLIYALLCGEKFNPKLYMWRKTDKYQVCVPPLPPLLYVPPCIQLSSLPDEAQRIRD